MRSRTITVAILLLVSAAAQTAPAELPKFPLRTDWAGDEVIAAPTAGGPEKVPQQLFGLWRVSLCVKPGMHRGHAWIRYQHVHTGEVHTVGRFQRHVRPTRRRATGEILYPSTKTSGLYWDYDWRFEHEVRAGKYTIGSVVVRDPTIFGHEDLQGHGTIRNNCITYARDAWQYYSGQQIELALVHTPEGFLRSIENEVQDIPGRSSPRMASQALRRLPPVR